VLRFQPDSWFEGLVRPLTLLDPSGYVYIEALAPDLRFAALLVLTGAALLLPRVRAGLSMPAWRTLTSLWLAFYIWTFVIGNGRYFVAGLLVVGPMLVLLVRSMPWSAPARALVLIGLIAVQGVMVHTSFLHGALTLARWADGPGLPIDRDTPVRHQPALFVTVSAISHAALVPLFHPASHWVNLVGQATIRPAMLEYERWRRLSAIPLPRYLVMYAVRPPPEAGAAPNAMEAAQARAALESFGLALDDDRPCEMLRSHWQPEAATGQTGIRPVLVYWICPLRGGALQSPEPKPAEVADEVFRAVERYCPRYFPPGGGQPFASEAGLARTYPSADTRLVVDARGRVMFQYFRATSATLIGTADSVRRGNINFDCDKLPGRYAFPWDRP
jgi:hypothetical protein